MNLKMFKKNKKLLILLIILVIGFILGMLFISFLDDNSQLIIKNNINDYFNGINNGEFQYLKSLYSVLTSNLILILIIWIMGISIIGGILGIFLLFYKSFLVGFSLVSIIYTFGFKAILISLLYILPEMLNLFLIFVLVYYSCSFSLFLINSLFKHKEYNRRIIVSRYIKLLIGSFLFVVVDSLLIVFLIPNILRIF